MSEQLPLSERTLQLAERVVEREASVEELARMSAQLLEGAQAGRAQFQQDSEASPELTADDQSVILSSMDAYIDALAAVHARAQAGSVETLGEPLAAARAALAAVREHQTRYQAACIYGPAMHPFLNRVLGHLEGMARRETDRRHTLNLLESLPAFMDEVGEQVGGIDEPLVLERSQAGLKAIADACARLRDALENGLEGDKDEFLGGLRQAILEGSDAVAEGLGFQFEKDLSVGRTPYPPVNLVLAACDRLITDHISSEHFREVVGQAVWLLAQRFPEESQDSVSDASREVRESLERLYALPPRPDPDEVVTEREVLRSATENLSMFVAVLQSEDEVFDLVQHEGLGGGGGGQAARGLPMMLAGLLQVGEQFLEGQASADDVLEGIALLEQTVSRSRGQLASARDSADRSKLLTGAIDHLTAAIEALRDMLERKGGRSALERAETEMHASQEAMKSLESRRPG